MGQFTPRIFKLLGKDHLTDIFQAKLRHVPKYKSQRATSYWLIPTELEKEP